MESSIAVFLMRYLACALVPTILSRFYLYCSCMDAVAFWCNADFNEHVRFPVMLILVETCKLVISALCCNADFNEHACFPVMLDSCKLFIFAL